MALIGNISIGMGINLKPFAKGLAQGKQQLSSFASGVASTAAGIATAFGIGAGFEGLKAMTLGAIDAADAAGDLAAQIGTSTGSLQSLQFAAKMTGGEVEEVGPALKKMSQNLGDAVIHGGPAADAIKSIGLNAKDLAQMDPADAFKAIAGGISKIPNPAQQASVAVDIFGKKATSMMELIRGGPAKFDELSKEAKRLGFALGDEQAAKLGEAQDAIDKLGFATQGLGSTLAGKLAPYLTMAVDGFSELVAQVSSGEGPLGKFTTFLGEQIDMGISFATTIVQAVSPAIESWFEGLTSLYDQAAAGEGFFGPLFNFVKSGFETVSFSIRNFGELFEIAKLTAVQALGNIVARLEVLPTNFVEITGFIGRNWKELLTDIWTGTTTFFSNLLTNGKDFATALWDAIQGKGFHFDPTPLMKGFQSSLKEELKLTEPEWINLDKELGAHWDKIAQNELARSQGFGGKIAEMEQKAIGKKKPGELTEGLGKEKGQEQFAKVAELNSAEGFSAVMKHLFGAGRDDPQKKLVKTADETLAVQREQLAEMKKSKGGVEVYRFS